MQNKTKTEDLMIRFLLGEVSEEERATVEERFLKDGQYFEHLLAEEESLIEAYIDNKLPVEQRTRAEALFKSSTLQWGEVELTREMLSSLREMKSTDQQPEAQSFRPTQIPKYSGLFSMPRSMMAVAVVGVVLGISLLVWSLYLLSQKHRLESERAALETAQRKIEQQLAQEQERARGLTDDLKTEQAKRNEAEALIAELQTSGPVRAVSAALYPDNSTRNTGTTHLIRLTGKVTRITLELDLANETIDNSSQVRISSFEGTVIWQGTVSAGRVINGKLRLNLPSRLFPNGDYRIAIEGSNLNKPLDYAFRVIK